jgi:transcription elongation GreA/GreB family factor
LDHGAFKAEVLKAGIKQQQRLIDDFRKRVNDIMTSEANEGDEYDAHQQSFRSETMAEVGLLSDQLQYAAHELDELKHIRNYEHERHPVVEYGTVVKTDRDTFFISVGVERFYVDDLPVFGISVQSPIYRVMKGKKVGDWFSDSGITYQIEEIF